MGNETLLGGRYLMGETIGRGGMATVVKARDMRLQRDVAVKQLRIDLAGDPTFQARFRREAHSSAGLNHPNIVSVYDTGEESDPNTGVSVPYIVMELVPGQTLRDILRDGRKIIPQRALEFTQGVLDALSYSHKAGIIHRDIKPANVMLTPSGQIKVMDFGIARAVADTSATMTQTAAVIGTAQYLSPEQARGETVDARSDIYSAGCLMYELLVGRPPFQGDSPVSVAYQHVREEPVPPSHIDPLITPSMDKVVLKSLAKDPAHRYQTAASMRADIGRLLSGQEVRASVPPVISDQPTVAVPTEAPAATTALMPQATAQLPQASAIPSRAVPETRSQRGWWWLVIVLAVALIVGGFFVLQQRSAPEKIAVPALYNKTKEEAIAELKALNLEADVVEETGEKDASVGRVLKQDPAPQTPVAPGTTVTITVNIGPKQQTIPSGLVGSDKATAEATLRNSGFTNVVLEPDPNAPKKTKENEVTRLSVEPGSMHPVDAKIVVYFASGKISVPNLLGLPKDRALASLNNEGLGQVRVETQESTAPEGTVIGQNPTAGATAKVGDPITIVIAIPLKEEPAPPVEPPVTPKPTP